LIIFDIYSLFEKQFLFLDRILLKKFSHSSTTEQIFEYNIKKLVDCSIYSLQLKKKCHQD